jgi:hypothetical protein
MKGSIEKKPPKPKLWRHFADTRPDGRSAFAELLAATRAVQTDFFTFDFTGIPGDKTGC